jgi:membrane protein required for colicin V production
VLTAFDYAVIAVIVLSALRGLWRGLLSEVFGLVGWVVAFLLAIHFVAQLAPMIPATWPGGTVTQWLVAFLAIVVGVMIVAGVANALLSRLVSISGLGGIDRSLGLLFGLIRGVVLVLLLVALAGLTELPQQGFWRNAMLRPYVEQGMREVIPLLPPQLGQYVRV